MELITDSNFDYPRIGFETLAQKIYDLQGSNTEEKKGLPRAQIELCFIGATKFDGVKGLHGKLNRGSFEEIIMRLSQARYGGKVVTHLQRFLDTYIQPIFEKSPIVSTRKTIRDSKQLNQLLFDNKLGLHEIFEGYKEPLMGFTFNSAQKLLNALDADLASREDATLVPDMAKIFGCSKMTQLNDKETKKPYYSLVYVEFLDFICRIAIALWTKHEKEEGGVEDKVFYLLELMWEWRAENPTLVPQREG